jgi:hypothetical protein
MLSSASAGEEEAGTTTAQLVAQYPGVTDEVPVTLHDHSAIDF